LLYAVYHQKLHPPFFPTLLGGSWESLISHSFSSKIIF
jgi:hypothetical protein